MFGCKYSKAAPAGTYFKKVVSRTKLQLITDLLEFMLLRFAQTGMFMGKRRMGVALARGETIDEALAKAKSAANAVRVKF